MNVIDLHRELGFEEPKVYKKLDGNKYEIEVFEKFPELKKHMINTRSGDVFKVEEKQNSIPSILKAIETPGHRLDHLSYAMKNESLNENILFAGDMILGTASVNLDGFYINQVSIDDLQLYMDDLNRALAMDFDKVFLVHTLDLKPESIVVDAKQKIMNYIKYRENRENLIRH